MINKIVICPKCSHKITFQLDFTGLFIFNNSNLRDICPNCHKRVIFKKEA